MTLLPRSLAVRLTLALLVAAGLVASLQLFVDQAEAASAAAAAAAPRSREPAWPGLGFQLAAVHGPIGLAHEARSLAPDVAPVVEVLAQGGLVLRRPARLAAHPGGATGGASSSPSSASAASGLGAAILLPGGSLAGLGPRARAALLDVLQQLIGERPVPATRLRAIDLVVPAHDLAALLAWLP